MPESVFLIWDNSRAEHGEGPELVCVYGNERSAQEHIEREADYSDIEESMDPDEIAEMVEEATAHLSIEERSVIG
jgi:hypothetical protein